MIKILSFISFYSIEELPFVSLKERKRNAITIARNVHSADSLTAVLNVLSGHEAMNCLYLFLNVLGSFSSA
jgi:hypothetical protein